MKYDFSGWATRNDLKCADGRTIRKNAFASQDGQKVPLVYNHDHNSVDNVLGHAILENREEGVYAYGLFNETPAGQQAKALVEHGDVTSLSIFANKLEQTINGDVTHGIIREVSLVLAGANPGAFIESVMSHSGDNCEGLIIGFDENIALYHSEDQPQKDESQKSPEDESQKSPEDKPQKSPEDILNGMSDEEKSLVYALVGAALSEEENQNEGDGEMKHSIFENNKNTNTKTEGCLSHSDEEKIVALAKTSSVGTFKSALCSYLTSSNIKHGISEDAIEHGVISQNDIETLFPEYKDVYPGEPETITRDMTWVDRVISAVHKSPITRIRTRQFDARQTGIRAKGYKKGTKKTDIGNVKLLSRTTDPQTIFVHDKLQRDDIVDFTDFSLVDYNYKMMRMALNEEIAIAIMVGDGREDGDPDKISEEHVRPIWTDDELYTIHYDVDIKGTEQELQGTDTPKHFSQNYIYAEAIIKGTLYSREKYKGSGSLVFYCTPHLLNIMLLARDQNGRRIYESKSDLASALNVSSIETVEQFEGLQRTTKEGKKKNLLGIFVNLKDYQVGSTKGGEISRFEDFDIDFNQYKYLMETRISGALTRVYSAIVLEEPAEDAGLGA